MLYANGKSFFQRLAEKHDPNVLGYGLLSKLRSAHQRTTACKVLDPWLRFRGFWKIKRMHITVKHSAFLSFAKSRVRSNAANIAAGHRLHYRWIISRFRISVGKPPLFSDRWNHAKVAEACTVSMVSMFPDPSQIRILSETGKWKRECHVGLEDSSEILD